MPAIGKNPGHVPVQRPATLRHRTSLHDEALEIIQAEYASELSLDDIARRIATSRRQLQRAFAEAGGTTFREAVAIVRMRKAAELLRDHRLTVGQVARRVGYRQSAQFAKAFRAHHGMVPSAYREHVRGLH